MEKQNNNSDVSEHIQQSRIEQEIIERSQNINGNRLDIIYGILFILVFTVAGQKDCLTLLNKIGLVLNIIGIGFMCSWLIFYIRLQSKNSHTISIYIRQLVLNPGRFHKAKKEINLSDLKSSKQVDVIVRNFTIRLIITGTLLLSALILVTFF